MIMVTLIVIVHGDGDDKNDRPGDDGTLRSV